MITFDKLTTAMQDAESRLAPFHAVRKLVMSELCGPWYLKESKDIETNTREQKDKRPTNLLAQVLDAYTPVGCPSIVTPKIDAKIYRRTGEARMWQEMVKRAMEELDFSSTFEMVFQDAFAYGRGIVKVGTAAGSKQIAVDTELEDIGEPYADRVDPSDFLCDMTAMSWGATQWRADRQRVTKQFLLELGLIEESIVLNLPDCESSSRSSKPSGTMDDTRSPDAVLLERVEVWDVYIYHGDQVFNGLRCSPHQGHTDWLIPPRPFKTLKGGPYVSLELIPFAANVMPISLGHRLLDLHRSLALSTTLMVDQINNYRRKFVVKPTPEAEDLAVELRDGGSEDITIGDPDSIKEVVVGGLDASTLQGYQLLLDMANNTTANLQQTAGKAGVADTATEAANMQENANRLLNQIKLRSRKTLKEVCRHVFYELYHDPLASIEFTDKGISGTPRPFVFSSAQRDPDSDFHDFTVEVDADSDPIDSPTRQRRVVELLGVMPRAVKETGGAGGDPSAVVEIIADEFKDQRWMKVFPVNAGAMQQMGMEAISAGQGPQAARAMGQAQAPMGQVGTQPIDTVRQAQAPGVPMGA